MPFHRILVTGSSGFIGQRLCTALAASGVRTLGLDKAAPVRRPLGWEFRQVDILDADALRVALAEFAPDAVVHLAARTDLAETRNLDGYAANIAGVENLLDCIRRTPSVDRAIFTSSQLVCKLGTVPRFERDCNPDTLYGQSKALTEKLVVDHNGGGVEWCIVRPTTVWGPGMSPHYRRFLKMIARGRYFHVGHSPLRKSYGYVGNVVHQYMKLLEAPAESIQRRTFYLADYEPLSLRDWADAIQRELGARPIPTLPEGAARTVARIGDAVNALGWKGFPFNSFRLNNVLTEYQFDLSPTREVCGPLPYDMNAGVAELVAWMRARKIV